MCWILCVSALIDRSLVLGPVDSPSVHDLVLDFSIGLHTEDELRQGHRRLVQLLRERRPGKPAAGSVLSGAVDITRFGWDLSLSVCHDRISVYVVTHLQHHVKGAQAVDWTNDVEMISALDDFPNHQDEVPLSVATVLGQIKCEELAKRSEKERNWWAASCRWSAIALSVCRDTSRELSRPFFVAAAAALESVRPTTPHAQQLVFLPKQPMAPRTSGTSFLFL